MTRPFNSLLRSYSSPSNISPTTIPKHISRAHFAFAPPLAPTWLDSTVSGLVQARNRENPLSSSITSITSNATDYSDYDSSASFIITSLSVRRWDQPRSKKRRPDNVGVGNQKCTRPYLRARRNPSPTTATVLNHRPNHHHNPFLNHIASLIAGSTPLEIWGKLTCSWGYSRLFQRYARGAKRRLLRMR